jgi:putative tryptophan/tyrosine transport system substrate-binding protein
MRRREFIAGLGGSAAAIPLAAPHAQQREMRRIGAIVGSADSAEMRARIAALRQALQQHGWIDGRNAIIDIRWAGSDPKRIAQEASDILATKPDVIMSGTSAAIAQILKASTIPVVFAGITDPVGQGFVESMPRPGRNATGFAAYEASLGGKWIEVLREVFPALNRVAIVYEPLTAPYMGSIVSSVVAAGPAFAVAVNDAPIRNVGELESAIAALGQQSGTGLIIPPAYFALTNSPLIIALAGKYRLPAIYAHRTVVTEGGLISYGIDVADQYAKAAGYVDRILRGAKPGELPVQGPTKFQLAVNLKTAKALGLNVPPTLLARADEVIE